MNNKHGFTLLELLIGMVIIGSLVAIGLRSFTVSQMRARDARRKGDLEQIKTAIELFYADKGYYPVNDSQGRLMIYKSAEETITLEWGEAFVDPDNSATIYMGNLPLDPSRLRYFYQADFITSDGQQAKAYRIFTFLENVQDQARLSEGFDGTNCHPNPATPLKCNFFISSTNLIN